MGEGVLVEGDAVISEPTAAEVSAPASWPNLAPHERRVLGVLVEKAKTTPEAYPLSLNALVTGCNQKSNRDPVMNLADHEVEDVLVNCQKQGLAIKITGGRVERWRHSLYEAWRADKVELAVLAELLLRGPQTEGELRTRASRMEPIADLDALRPILRNLAERRLIVYLTEEGRRGTMLSHGFHSPAELEHYRSAMGKAAQGAEAPRSPASQGAELPRSPGQADALAQIADLRTALGELQAQVAMLAAEVRSLRGEQESARPGMGPS